jgi:hypothetical protein
MWSMREAVRACCQRHILPTREREREREIDRQTDRESERARKTERKREGGRQRDRQRERERERESQRPGGLRGSWGSCQLDSLRLPPAQLGKFYNLSRIVSASRGESFDVRACLTSVLALTLCTHKSMSLQ